MKSKSKITKIFVWTQLIPACTKGTRLTLQGLRLLTISLAVLFPATVAFAQAVFFSPATNFLVCGVHPGSVAIADLNGYWKPDLAVVTRNDIVSILLNTMISAPGGPFVVNSTADTVDAKPGDGICADSCGNCTLRAAIMEANALSGADTITLPAGTYTLTIPGVNEEFAATGDLDINSDLTITGAGANLTTIDASGIDRVLEIRPENKASVQILGLTVTHGSAGTITRSGGGILFQGSLLTLTNVTVSDSTAAGYGGGIFVGGPVILNNSTVSGNSALGAGGGIINYINGTLTLNNSTVSGNSAEFFGGGIAASNYGNTLILNNSTVSGNTNGGLNQQAGTVFMKNTILAGNGGGNCRFQVQSQLSGALISRGHNLSTDNSCTPTYIVAPNVSGGLDQPTDLNNTPAQLAPLALNLPGSTKTHALLPGSPAIDKGGDCLTMDQRGVPRPQGAGCDIGAYELGVATFVANSTADAVDAVPGNGSCATITGLCTLRAAIMEANALAGDDIIILPAGTYTLSIPGVSEDLSATGDLDITSELTITGAGANITTIDGGGIDRVLEIRPGSATNVLISGLTVTGGKTLSPGGGGIRNDSTLTLTNVTVSANSADIGAGIYNDEHGTLTVNSSTVSGNAATINNGGGGGIFSQGIGHTVTLNSSTISGNTAIGASFGAGGGIWIYHGTLVLNNSTVSGNVAKYGGGIVTSNWGIILTLNNSTISGNSGIGGGISLGEYATINLKNTIVAGNSSDCLFGPTDVANSLGHNLDSDGTCRLDPAKGDLKNTAAQLAPLALNLPGSTKTHALCTGPGAPDPSCGAASPAIDKGGDCLAMDQRGVPRTQGAACDIGAYEVGSVAPTGSRLNPPPGLKGWWPLDETTGTTAADIIGGHNGTALPGPIGAFTGSGPVTSVSWPPPSFIAGKVSTSLFFDGNRRVEVPHNSVLEPGTGDFTVDAWVFYSAVGNGRLLTVAQKNTGATAQFGNTVDGWRFVIRDSSSTQGLVFFIGALGVGGSVGEPITPNTWHHVSATLSTNASGFRIVKNYVDGVSLSQVGLNGNITSTAPLLIGGDGMSGGPIAVDEVQIFNRALTQQEIQAIFNAGNVGKCKCVPPPSGLVSWWPGDGNANDIQDGNNGTLVEGVTYAPGKVNQAFSFPSLSSTGSDRVGLTTGPSANTFTIEAWVFADQITSPNGYRTIYADNVRGFWLKSGKLNWWRGGDRFVGNTTVTLGAWHHIALTYSQGTFTGYLNGAVDGTSLFPGESLPTGTGLGIGGHSNFVPEDFDGRIDELRIYNRALDPAEILAIFNAGSTGSCKTVVSPNRPPLANAGPDQTVEATSSSGASVTLNGSGSSDPDSNPLTYNWTGPFGTASTVSPTITLPLGTHTVTLKVNDGQATATDTVNITVRDTTPPDTMINSAIDGNETAVTSGGSTLSGSITLTFGGTDIVGVAGFQCRRDGSGFAPCTSPAGHSALAIGNHNFQVRAVDAAGNIDPTPAGFTWTVITPTQAIQNLITAINNMGLPGGVTTSLTAPLSNINTNNKASACGKLNAFINQVNAKVQNGQLTPAQASQLLQAANAISASLGC